MFRICNIVGRVSAGKFLRSQPITPHSTAFQQLVRNIGGNHKHDDHDHDHDDHENDIKDPVIVNFKKKNGTVVKTVGYVGDCLLRLAQRNEIELEGACEGVCACSTCHVILENDVYDSLPVAEEKEEDMLDQAYGLTLTSRLSCQIKLTKELNNMTVTLPSATRNFYVDGHVPKPH